MFDVLECSRTMVRFKFQKCEAPVTGRTPKPAFTLEYREPTPNASPSFFENPLRPFFSPTQTVPSFSFDISHHSVLLSCRSVSSHEDSVKNVFYELRTLQQPPSLHATKRWMTNNERIEAYKQPYSTVIDRLRLCEKRQHGVYVSWRPRNHCTWRISDVHEPNADASKHSQCY